MKTLIIASLALGLASAAFAAPISITSVIGGSPTGTERVNFDDFALNSTTQWASADLQVVFSGTDSKAVQGSVPNEYAAPFLSGDNGAGFGPGGTDQADGADMTTYLSAGTGSISFNFTMEQRHLGLLWGSVDDYNTLAFYSGGSLIQSFTGLDVTAFADGDRGADGTFRVTFNSDVGFDQVIASSSVNSFEIDNLSFSIRNQVPDSGTTLALLGLALIGLVSIRRKL